MSSKIHPKLRYILSMCLQDYIFNLTLLWFRPLQRVKAHFGGPLGVAQMCAEAPPIRALHKFHTVPHETTIGPQIMKFM